VAGLLTGVRVVETGVLMAVDHLGRLLGDEGADVVKVETPQLGDYLRNIMTRFAPDWSTFHLALNRGKRSVTVDARVREGREVMTRLIGGADVFITGNVGATNHKLGLDYDAVRAIRPDIVYCQVTGFGARGPYAEIPTHGQMMENLGGAAPQLSIDDRGFVVTTGPEGDRRAGGVVVGPMFAAFGVAAGLARAARTGSGCYIDVSCADAVLATSWIDAIPNLNPEKVDPTGPVGEPTGSAKYQHYETKDGRYVLFCAIEPKFWRHFCRAVGREDLLDEHRHDLVVDFGRGDDDLRRELQGIFHTRTLAAWIELAIDADVALGPALRFEEVASDPHLRAREMIVTERHPVVGDFQTLGNPLLVNGASFEIRSAPAHGEHTDEILGELGYDADAREALRAAAAI
jgi:crotonobetainyl-CoA:carnitine CoA-transferase CaiB-like acyl-CoA transferase